jgi:bifunctional NMN adenylyltransferase/nudix hydrolase
MRLGVFIGRFQPLHEGHVSVITRMVVECDLVLVLIGSANTARSVRNPYTFVERREHFQRMFGSKVLVAPINDHPYDNDAWVKEVRATIGVYLAADIKSVTLFGHMKDGNDYLKWFPEFNYCDMPSTFDTSGSAIRDKALVERSLPQEVLEEHDYAEAEKALFKDYPYANALHFVTADAVVTCGSQVLLVLRKDAPGRGLWALPGGFKNADESALDCARRECEEETSIKNVNFDRSETFHCPSRHLQNSNIPRVTIAFHGTVSELDSPIEGDDAAAAAWFDAQWAVDNLQMFSDHRWIICKLLELELTPAHITGAEFK